MGDRRNIYSVLVAKSEGKKSLGRPRNRYEIVLKWIFRRWDVGWTGCIWIRTRKKRRELVNAVRNLRVP
jgi:hypothetical protein